MEKQVSDSGKAVGKSNTGLFIFAGFLVLAITIAATAYFYFNRPVEGEPEIRDTADGRGIVLTRENMDEVLNAEPVDPGYFETAMTNEWTFVGGKSDSKSVYVMNAETNRNTIYFDLLVGEKLVYSSPYIPVGAELPQFELTGSLEPGDYSGTVTYHLVDDENKDVSEVSVGVTLHIK